jgi:ubiquinol-cytochrome c reductase iron-sulfur subunit
MADAASPSESSSEHVGTRRDFLVLAAGAMGGMAAVGVTWPLIETMNPSADVLALASTEVDLSSIEEGQTIVVKWRGRPVFVRYRTAEEIAAARAVALDDLSDPQPDAERAPQAQWLIVEGVCTHLGCVPLGSKLGDPRGDYGGWFCPCHGSHYDTAGRIRKGPAPANLKVPTYEFLDDTLVRIG